MKYKVGKSKTESKTTHQVWNVPIGVAKSAFSASISYSGFVEKTNNETWNEEKEQTYTINVTKGKSVWVWQFVFSMSQYGDEVNFQCSIVGDTDSEDKKPLHGRI